MDREHKWKFKDGRAYTEDNVLVYNISVSRLPNYITMETFSTYFNKFGKILEVDIERTNEGQIFKGFIHFADSNAAYTALQEHSHVVMRKHLFVEPRETWNQPYGQHIIKCLKNNLETNSITNHSKDYRRSTNSVNEPLIFSLNKNCIQYIYKKLPLKDQINLALTCQLFCGVFETHSESEYKTVKTYELLDLLTPWEFIVFIQIKGSQVTKLHIDYYFGDNKLIFLEFITSFCKNVENLNIEKCISLRTTDINTTIREMPLLKELKCTYLEDEKLDLRFLNKLKDLDILKSSISGENLELPNGLEKLSLSYCKNFKADYFNKIFRELTNLRYLDIKGFYNLKSCDYKNILLYLTELETIKLVPDNENINCIAKLPKLKSLEIKDSFDYSEEFFQNLATHQADQLEELIVYFNINNTIPLKFYSLVGEFKKLKILLSNIEIVYEEEILNALAKLLELEVLGDIYGNITNMGFLKLLQNCKKLKSLNLVFCDLLTPDPLCDVLKLLQEQRAHGLRSDLLHITFTGCKNFDKNSIKVCKKIEELNHSDVLKVKIE